MKKCILALLFLALSINLFANADEDYKSKIEEYNSIFEQIGEKRVGVLTQKIDKTVNPFIMTSKQVIVQDGNETVIKKDIYTLSGIFSNKAKINDIWYKLDSKIGDFKLLKIKKESVIIANEHSKKELFIRKSNVSKIKFSSK